MDIPSIPDPIDRFAAFVFERNAIYQRRLSGGAAPWTSDAILSEYRFCNVYREHDRVTRWIADNWRAPNASDIDLWFAMVVARFVNKPETLELLGYPVPWDREHFLCVMLDLLNRGTAAYGAAYMITASDKGVPKPISQCDRLFGPLWNRRLRFQPKPQDSLRSYYDRLGEQPGLGSFMTAQVVADLKYVDPLEHADDWWTFAAPGPGSRRGLNRILGRAVDTNWSHDADWRAALRRLNEKVAPVFADGGLAPVHAQDLQNCLCEFDKYERARLGEGRPKQKFRQAHMMNG